jgi:hypothetical protein
MPDLVLLVSSSLHPGHPSLRSFIPLARANNSYLFSRLLDKKGDVINELGPTIP